MWRLACLLIGYVCGNVLFAEILARTIRHSSIFEMGSGNPGMTNTIRTMGIGPGLLCLAGDICKVLVAVFACHAIFPAVSWQLLSGWAGLGATLGHDYPAWHAFRGGEGVTTTSSMFFLVDWRGAMLAGLVAGISLVLNGYLCIVAMIAASAYVLWCVLMAPMEITLLATAAWVLVLLRNLPDLRDVQAGKVGRDIPPLW